MRKMADRAVELGKDEMATALVSLTERAPDSLYEAMVTMSLYYDLQQSLECSFVRALNRVDSLFYPFYKKEIDRGTLTIDGAKKLTDEFLKKLDSFRVPANVAFTVAGTRLDGSTCVNEYTYILIERLIALKLPFVKVHFLYDANIPEDLMRMVFNGIRSGGNSIVFISDRATKKALMGIGISREDADNYTVVGCYETCGMQEVPCTCAGRINLAKALEVTINGGFDMITGQLIDYTEEADFESFDALFSAFLKRLDSFAEAVFDLLDKRESLFPMIHSSPLFSSTMDVCVERGGDIYEDFSAKYNNTSINALGLATATDSLLAIKKLVYDDQSMTLGELVKILKNNWEGQELLRKRIKCTFPTYGVGDKYADSLARAILERLANKINGRPNVKGGVYRFGAFTVDWRFPFGKHTAAGADGRLCGEALSKNICATLGGDRKGVTAHIASGAAMGGEITPNGSVLDVVMHSSAVQGENGIKAMLATLKAFVEMGGTAIQYNVLNAETLRDAQKSPENYPNLQVRVCGWNALFSSLTEEEQNEFIKQAEEA
jgi:formate C-acetyltransferase